MSLLSNSAFKEVFPMLCLFAFIGVLAILNHLASRGESQKDTALSHEDTVIPNSGGKQVFIKTDEKVKAKAS
jgi:hypothetical protein